VKKETIMSDQNNINNGITKSPPPTSGGDLEGAGVFPGEVHQTAGEEF
jgi:hypothetical protein